MYIQFVVLAVVAIGASLLYAAWNYFKVKKMDPGTPEMQEIANAIREGANAFILHEYKIIIIVAAVVAVALSILLDLRCAIAFLMGVAASTLACVIGMKIATYANVRVTNTAKVAVENKDKKSLGKALKVAFRGGSVSGLCVHGIGLLGFFLCVAIFGMFMGLAKPENIEFVTNPIGVSFIPYMMVLTAYSIGCSLVALFARIGGGIFTKGADMGADLVGKTEEHIPEDDYRNPAVIADNVGDNVGDVAGNSSDLLESNVAAIASATIMALTMIFISIRSDNPFSAALIERLTLYPLAFSLVGLIACVFGIGYVLLRKPSDKPSRELNISLWSSAALIAAGTFLLSWLVFGSLDLSGTGFNMGFISPWIGGVIGVAAGIIIGWLAEYYTSSKYKPTQKLADITKDGTALTIGNGLALGMKSCFAPGIVLAITLIAANSAAGFYGIAMAAVGMLSFVGATITVDSYGPIADNAGGISEMAHLDESVRTITDSLDAVGNTTAAVAKGFAIGSGALAALSLLISYMHSSGAIDMDISLNLLDPRTIGGAFVGGMLIFMFSGLIKDAVTNNAKTMVEEVRRQFAADPGILAGTSKPDSKRCVQVCTKGAIKLMIKPVAISLAVAIITGALFEGKEFVGGFLFASTIVAIGVAIFCANSGGAWDNAKKEIESMGLKGTERHISAIVGDTVGDSMKDAEGVSMDIIIKLMSTVQILLAPVLILVHNLIFSFIH